jgi:hypothetical protein
LPVVSVIEMTGPAGADAWSKNHATPQPRVPAQSGAANNRRRCDDDRCHWCDHDRCRWGYNDWGSGGDDDRAFIGAASSVGIAVKAGATAAFGTGAVDSDERE